MRQCNIVFVRKRFKEEDAARKGGNNSVLQDIIGWWRTYLRAVTIVCKFSHSRATFVLALSRCNGKLRLFRFTFAYFNNCATMSTGFFFLSIFGQFTTICTLSVLYKFCLLILPITRHVLFLLRALEHYSRCVRVPRVP